MQLHHGRKLAPQMQGREKKEEMIANGKTILYVIV
jgi:hypothetical protein